MEHANKRADQKQTNKRTDKRTEGQMDERTEIPWGIPIAIVANNFRITIGSVSPSNLSLISRNNASVKSMSLTHLLRAHLWPVFQYNRQYICLITGQVVNCKWRIKRKLLFIGGVLNDKW